MTQTPEAPSTAQQLADLIDAYAAAKMTGNETLVKIAVGPLQQFLASHDITPKAVNYDSQSEGLDSAD